MKFLLIETEDGYDILSKDGGVATLHHNGEHIVATLYHNRISRYDNSIWEQLSEGKVSIKDYVGKDDYTYRMIEDCCEWLRPDAKFYIPERVYKYEDLSAINKWLRSPKIFTKITFRYTDADNFKYQYDVITADDISLAAGQEITMGEYGSYPADKFFSSVRDGFNEYDHKMLDVVSVDRLIISDNWYPQDLNNRDRMHANIELFTAKNWGLDGVIINGETYTEKL